MNCSLFIKGISAAAATIICSYVSTQYLGKNIMYAIGGAIAGTGITTIFTDRIARQIEANQILLGQPQPNSWRGYANDYAQGKPLPIPTNCKGCKYYHGIPYNGVTLNCAIHPQGCFGEQCPDWQGFQESIQLDPTERIVNILFQPDEDEPTGHVTIFRCLGDWHEEELTKPCEFATSVVSIASPLACPITSDLKMDKYCEKSGFIRTSIGMKKKIFSREDLVQT
ncbi:MAG: hypothetical protein ACYT04_53215 [Nostoc sp.]